MATLTCALGPDSAGSLLTELILSARERIDAAVYEVGPSYAGAFATVASRGAEVRLVLDAHPGANSGALRRLGTSRALTRTIGGRPGHEAHCKLLRVDADRIAIGSGNLIARDAPRNPVPPHQEGDVHAGTREWWALVEGVPRFAGAVTDVIDAAWREPAQPIAHVVVPTRAPMVGVPRPMVAPLRVALAADALRMVVGGAHICDVLAQQIAAASARVHCTVPYAHCATAPVARLLDELDGAAARGCDVRLLLGAVPAAEDAAHLTTRDFGVRVMDPRRCTTGHAKGAVLDGVVMISSANWSAAGLGGNLEAALAVTDRAAADHFAAALGRDWAVSKELGRPVRPSPRTR